MVVANGSSLGGRQEAGHLRAVACRNGSDCHLDPETKLKRQRNRQSMQMVSDGFLQVNIPCSLRKIGACKNCNQVVKEGYWESYLQNCESLAIITIHESLTAIGVSAFSACESLAGITVLSLTLWRPLGTVPSKIAFLWKASQSPSQRRTLGCVPFAAAEKHHYT